MWGTSRVNPTKLIFLSIPITPKVSYEFFSVSYHLELRVAITFCWHWLFFYQGIAHPHLLVRATNKRFLPTRITFESVLASESHRLHPVLVLTVLWGPAPVSVGGLQVISRSLGKGKGPLSKLFPIFLPSTLHPYGTSPSPWQNRTRPLLDCLFVFGMLTVHKHIYAFACSYRSMVRPNERLLHLKHVLDNLCKVLLEKDRLIGCYVVGKLGAHTLCLYCIFFVFFF